MNRMRWPILLLCLPLAAAPAGARDLWGDSGVILSEEDTPVLTRTVRLTPQTRLVPAEPASVTENEPPLETAETAPPAPPEGRSPASDLDPVESVASEPVPGEPREVATVTSTPPSGRISTAPPIPGRGGAGSPRGDFVADEGVRDLEDAQIAATRDETRPPSDPQADEMAEVQNPESEGPDISDVELFGVSPDEETAVRNTGGDETEVASLGEPGTRTQPEASAQPRRPPPQFNSVAYAGIFAGVGPAEGMRLRLGLDGAQLEGSFTDSSGQSFRVDGQLTETEGRAQAVVVSANVPVGYMDFQLTNLGLTALFVPLSEELTPLTGDARQYEFLRTLSPAARSALEAERNARESTVETSPANGQPRPRRETGPLRETYPGDDDTGP